MSRWKLIVVALLSAFPILLFAGFGGWELYRSGRWFWLWWSLPICWGAGSILGRLWSRDLRITLPELDLEHWTPQDQAAMQIVTEEQARVDQIPSERLTDPQFYAELSQNLALKVARHYRPNADDPLGDRTVVEILAAMQLISADVEEMFIKYVPASHLMTVSQWKMLSRAPRWWQTASAAGWVASIALNPINIARYFASRLTMEPLTKQVQQNLLGAFYTLYVRQTGFYLIELHSGRLRGGSQRYREHMQRLQPAPSGATSATGTTTKETSTPGSSAAGSASTLTIAVIGQVKAGKSSLINVLLGGQRAATDVLPATQSVVRHALRWPGSADELILLDTPGYSDAGATAQQLRETSEAVRQADLYLLVLDVRSPARDADVKSLTALEAWFRDRPHYKPPKLIIVLNKIDGLSPVMEWSPPYNWQQPAKPKEQNIAAALEYAREVFGDRAVAYVPVCADLDHQREWGVLEQLPELMNAQLKSARASSVLRQLRGSFEQGKVRQVIGQVLDAGKRVFDSM